MYDICIKSAQSTPAHPLPNHMWLYFYIFIFLVFPIFITSYFYNICMIFVSNLPSQLPLIFIFFNFNRLIFLIAITFYLYNICLIFVSNLPTQLLCSFLCPTTCGKNIWFLLCIEKTRHRLLRRAQGASFGSMCHRWNVTSYRYF